MNVTYHREKINKHKFDSLFLMFIDLLHRMESTINSLVLPTSRKLCKTCTPNFAIVYDYACFSTVLYRTWVHVGFTPEVTLDYKKYKIQGENLEDRHIILGLVILKEKVRCIIYAILCNQYVNRRPTSIGHVLEWGEAFLDARRYGR